MVGLTTDEVEVYLEDRRQKGFNAVIVNLIERSHSGADNTFDAPTNRYGSGPFTVPGDFSTPNEAYFAHADWVIRQAGSKGMVVLLAPCYVGLPSSADGWSTELMANGEANCQNYGRWLGSRYKDFPNIIWVMYGDHNPNTVEPMVTAMAAGMREFDTTHLFTAHFQKNYSARDFLENFPWLGLNTSYTAEIVYGKCLKDYNRTPPMPSILIEARYEGEESITTPGLRRQAYSALLSGASGHAFGNSPIWLFGGGWQNALNSAGSATMIHVRNLFLSRPWHLLEPDDNHQVLTAGFSTSSTYVPAARTIDGASVIAYLPFGGTITLDLSKLSGNQVNAWWFDVRDGTAASAGTYATTGSQAFTAPSTEDWVLVLDDLSYSFSAPGGAPYVLTPQQPVITWNKPTSILYGAALDGTQLKAAASVPGSFAYVPPAGTVPNAGLGQTLTVTFTPDDQTRYLTVHSSVTLDVARAALTITAQNKSKTYGAANPALTATYSGFVNGDTAVVLDSPVRLSTTATTGSPVGSYPIIASGAADVNYTIGYVAGTFEVAIRPLLTETVAWQKVVGASVGSNVILTKTAAAGWENAGGSSTRGVAAGADGYAEFTIPADGGRAFLGLSHGDAGPSYAEIDYALYPHPGQGLLIIYEKGVYVGSFGAFAPGNKLKITVHADTVQYWRDGSLLRTSVKAPTYPLCVDTSLYSTGTTIPPVTLAGTELVSVVSTAKTEVVSVVSTAGAETVAWQNVVGASVSAGALTKTAGAGWANAGASSTRAIGARSSGSAEFTVPAGAGYVFFGLSNGDTGPSVADIGYAFYPQPSQGLLVIYEKGVYVGNFGPFAPGDKLKITVQKDVVQYWRNGVLLKTSPSAPTYPLRVDTSLYSTGATIPAVTLAGTNLVSVVTTVTTETVAWQNVVGATAGSGVLTKTAVAGWTNSGAFSTRGIAPGSDGYAEFTIPADGGYAFFGLSNGDSGQSSADVDYAFYPRPGQGLLIIYEKGVYVGSFGAFAPGDKLKISVQKNVVQYWRNGVLLKTSASVPTYPLGVDTSLYSPGATIPAVTLTGTTLLDVLTETVAWQNVVGASVGAGVLSKTAAAGWANAGACSTRGIAPGNNGYAEFTVPSNGGYVFFGLSNGDSGQGFADIDYAFYPHPGQGLLIIYEKGVYIGSFGAFAPGNKLRVSVQKNAVQYWRDGVLLRTSPAAPAYPLRVDTSLYSTGATIMAVTLEGTSLIDTR